MKRVKVVAVALALFLFIQLASAGELVYTPINPSFGGSSFNAQWLMNQAQQQNTFTAPTAPESRFFGRSPLENFQESLNRQILSRLASQITRNVFGETPLEPGHFEIGTFSIDVSEGTDGIHITIFDSSTGGETNIVVPYF